MSSYNAMSLESIPQEILEQIALFAATDTFLGPPSAIIPLLCTNRKIYSSLSIASNTALYAKIFISKFDTAAAIRRLGPQCTTAVVLCSELQRRCIYLKRIRTRLDSTVGDTAVGYDDEMLRSTLWMAFLMMLEDEGKNKQQLRDYAQIGIWIKEYWFDPQGASFASIAVRADRWPPNNERTSLAMWLFWFLLDPDEYAQNEYSTRTATNMLKLMALGAHQYSLSSPPWVHFIPEPRPRNAVSTVHFGETHLLTPPPLATPAILSFLTLANKYPTTSEGFGYTALVTPSTSIAATVSSQEWECEWARCQALGQARFDQNLSGTLMPGTIEGVWEGIFTYTEFTAYASLLAGAVPKVLHRSLVAQHRQTWKLREHHLVADPAEVPICQLHPLSGGDPLKGYFPNGSHIQENRDGLEVQEPGRPGTLHYQRAPGTEQVQKDGQYIQRVQDIIITGEGHSAWGQFNLIGRVRPCDGFISLSKDYVDGDRGKWLYRGYLVGNVNGNLAGRWRDTLSRADVPGYEGCFVMSRRR